MSARCLRTLALITVFLAARAHTCVGDSKAWLNASYDVRVHVAVDSSANPGLVDDTLISQLERIVHRNLYPYWKCIFTTQSGELRSTLLRQIDVLDRVEADFETGNDKTLYLSIMATGGGVRLSCREQDRLTGRWTPVIDRESRQELLLAQTCFELLCDTFSSRALVQFDPSQNDQVALLFQGSALLSDDNKRLLTQPHRAFQPFLVRSNHSGSSVGNVVEVPWTYLVTAEPEGNSWKADIFSGTRRPFGARSRAGIDIVALELKPSATGTVVRFHAGHNPEQALAGYEVFEKAANADEFQPTGFTDDNGDILVMRGDFPITLVALRADAQPLVQVPVAPGSVAQLQIPVSDDMARLRVQESLTTFREQMVDVVARRNILMARARDQMKKGKRQEAKELLAEIGDLPTRANMDRFLATLERDPASHSENARVQAKIDRLFADSRKMMSTYLTTREILELETEINSSAAQVPE